MLLLRTRWCGQTDAGEFQFLDGTTQSRVFMCFVWSVAGARRGAEGLVLRIPSTVLYCVVALQSVAVDWTDKHKKVSRGCIFPR